MALPLAKILSSLLASLTALASFFTPMTATKLPTTLLSYQTGTIVAELATTPLEQAQGLSGRQGLGPDQGMLFVFPTDVQPAFWMKEMNFPLDLIWLRSDDTVSEITRDLATSTYPGSVSPREPIRYVLEVNAGYAEKHHLKVGDKIKIDSEILSR